MTMLSKELTRINKLQFHEFVNSTTDKRKRKTKNGVKLCKRKRGSAPSAKG